MKKTQPTERHEELYKTAIAIIGDEDKLHNRLNEAYDSVDAVRVTVEVEMGEWISDRNIPDEYHIDSVRIHQTTKSVELQRDVYDDDELLIKFVDDVEGDSDE